MIKKVLFGLGLCSLLAFPATNASAQCDGVSVISAGANGAQNVVKLRNTSGAACGNWAINQDLYFILDKSQNNGNSMLATALSAQASGYKLLVILADRSNVYSHWKTLNVLFATAQ